MTTAISICSFVLCASFANAQNKASNPPTLYIGDKAPAFKPIGAVKGTAISEFKKGKTYVIEFWATWCGPCIASMPHLSELAEKYKGKVDFYGVNIWDFKTANPKVKEEMGAHSKRVSEWVKKNTDKMRYNVVSDDQKDTIANAWMSAAQKDGIPCTFIVNDEGKVAWIGHPAEMEGPLKSIAEKKWDLSAFKAEYEKEDNPGQVYEKVRRNLTDAIKKGDRKAIDAFIDDPKPIANFKNRYTRVFITIAIGANENSSLAYEYFKKYDGKVEDLSSKDWLVLLSEITSHLEDASGKADLTARSSKYVKTLARMSKPTGYCLYAIILRENGDNTEAKSWLEKARNEVKDMPQESKEGILKWCDEIEKTIK